MKLRHALIRRYLTHYATRCFGLHQSFNIVTYPNSNPTMTIARRQWQRPMVLTSIKKQSKKSMQFWCLVATGVILLFIFIFLQHPFYSDAKTLRSEKAKDKSARLFTSPKDLPIDLINSLDAILVLGGGRPRSIDHPPVFVERRCDDAIEVVQRRFKSNGNKSLRTYLRSEDAEQDRKRRLPILCLSAGTAHLPQLLSVDGLPIWESTACAAYILSKNETSTMIPPDSIHVETSSYDTIGNAYFARTAHTEFNGWRKLLIITNEFHMERTAKIFDWIFSVPISETISKNTGSDKLLQVPYNLYYLESPNVGMASEVIKARKERESSSSKKVEFLSKTYPTMRDVYKFLTQEHSLYSIGLVDRGRATAIDVKEGSVKDAVKRSYGAN